jgi:hypothetical protein
MVTHLLNVLWQVTNSVRLLNVLTFFFEVFQSARVERQWCRGSLLIF